MKKTARKKLVPRSLRVRMYARAKAPRFTVMIEMIDTSAVNPSAGRKWLLSLNALT